MVFPRVLTLRLTTATMPAIREPSTPLKSERRSSPYPTPSPSSGSKGWTQEQKSMLFDHVRQNGEMAWEKACPGKTSQQSREQWKWAPLLRDVGDIG